MNPIVYAIPIFLLMILIEVIATIIRKKDYYRVNDAINSLSTGMLNVTTGVIFKLGIYTLIYNHAALLSLDSNALWVWVLGFVLQDFFYYWNHRKGHEINLLWAAHSVHHQSEEYNLTTALRQTSTGFLFSWVFYVPMAIVGIPPYVFLTVSLMNLLYQYWVHTRHIPKLGWFERLFVTPSNHRVHHAKNRKYLDKNYGGVFIIWDRLFGTFIEEDENYEPIRYGTLTPLRSWNPVWANLHLYTGMCRDAFNTKSWKDKLTLWFRRTGYRPADIASPMKMPDIHGYKNYNPDVSMGLKVYALIHFAMLVLATTVFLAISHNTPYGFNALWTFVLALNLIGIGWLLEKFTGLIVMEAIRFVFTGATIVVSNGIWIDLMPDWTWQFVLVSGVMSLLVLKTSGIASPSAYSMIPDPTEAQP
ncbi:sterol desaturase family protein [Salinisphaera sp. G21_0]|uniref:sterol desaturase family protein n=1 Tax=Salinisphaera sp. G21_0 TaxID=2821094 RepID=UPI001ADA63E3|nr:sterol desaturase family protein [Salinisphaera sp. G21_0]MBO9480707.1 sterol desaturase family protein [Salinisphaera sp. G21_0]